MQMYFWLFDADDFVFDSCGSGRKNNDFMHTCAQRFDRQDALSEGNIEFFSGMRDIKPCISDFQNLGYEPIDAFELLQVTSTRSQLRTLKFQQASDQTLSIQAVIVRACSSNLAMGI